MRLTHMFVLVLLFSYASVARSQHSLAKVSWSELLPFSLVRNLLTLGEPTPPQGSGFDSFFASGSHLLKTPTTVSISFLIV